MKYSKYLTISVLLVAISFCSYAENYVLDLDESISIAKMRSYDMLLLKQDLKIADYDLKSTIRAYRTHVNLDLVAPKYVSGIQQYEDSTVYFYNTEYLKYNATLSVSQPLPTNGSIYMTNYMGSYDDYIDKERSLSITTEIGISQPIDALYGYNKIKSNLKKAQLNYEQTEKSLKREELDLIYSVSNSFYSLLKLQKGKEIAKMNLERQKDAYDMAKNKYDAGLIREVDALQMEVDLAEAQNNYELAVLNQESALNSFKELLGLEYSDNVSLKSKLDYQVVIVDPQKAVQLAKKNRLEVREQDIQIELKRLSLKQQKSSGMITGNLNAYYKKTGISDREIDNGLGNSIDGAYEYFKSNKPNFGLGFTVSIPVFDWGENRALVRSSKESLQKSIYKKEEIQRAIESEVLSLVSEVNTSLKRLQLLEKNVAVAEKSFEITRKRFADGDIDSQDLALERERLNTAYESHLSAYISYQLKLSDLMRKTFYDFVNDKPVE